MVEIMVPESPDIIGPLMQAVLTCAETQLDAHGRGVGRVLLSSGDAPAWDDCCEGQLWVRLITMFPTGNPFPLPDVRAGSCKPTMLGSTLGVGVLRCAAVVDEAGNAPAADTITNEALGATADAMIVLEALKCCVGDLTDDQTSNALAIMLGTWTPLGVEGGCVGGEWTLTLGTGTCGCPEG